MPKDVNLYEPLIVSRAAFARSPETVLASDRYVHRTLSLIEADLAAQRGLGELAEAVGLSPFQLHRRFHRVMGESVGDYLRRVRLGFAMTVLGHHDIPIIDVAMEVGYNSHAAFTRAFTRQFGLAPERARALAAERLPRATGDDRQRARQVRLERLDPVPLLAMRFHGPYHHVPDHWQRFAAHLHGLGFDLTGAQAVGILYDDPAFTPPDRIRYDCCIVDNGFTVPPGLGGLRRDMTRPGERARLDVAGPYPAVAQAIFSIVKLWLPQMQRVLSASPACEVYRRPPWLLGDRFDLTVLVAVA